MRSNAASGRSVAGARQTAFVDLTDDWTDLPGLDPVEWLQAWCATAPAGVTVLERLPVGGCMSLCAYEPVEEDAEFREALAASRSPLVYASVDYWSDDDAAPMLAGLGPDLDDDWAGPERAGHLVRVRLVRERTAAAAESQCSAVVGFAVDGIWHQMRVEAPWMRALRIEGGVLRRQADADRQAWHVEFDQAIAMEQAALAAELQGLELTLLNEPEFWGCRQEPARRRFAHALIARAVGADGELDARVRGEASAAAERAWRRWRTEVVPERERALRERLPELANDPALQLPRLEARVRAARHILTSLDEHAATPALADELARLAADR